MGLTIMSIFCSLCSNERFLHIIAQIFTLCGAPPSGLAEASPPSPQSFYKVLGGWKLAPQKKFFIFFKFQEKSQENCLFLKA
jgi:hypothetical protein